MNQRLIYLIVGLLLLGGLLISACYAPIWYDDAGHFLVAQSIAEGRGMCYPLDAQHCQADSPFITMGPVLAYPLGWWMRLFGANMLVARAFMAIMTLAATAAFWALARNLTSSLKATLSVGMLALNIQFLTYGAEVLGELPMMGLVFAGLLLLLNWQRTGRHWQAGLAILAWILAVGIKEYVILPLSIGLLLAFFLALRKDAAGESRKPWAWMGLGLGWMVALVGWMLLSHGGWAGLQTYLDQRGSYGSEFLAFLWGNSLKFLLFKPLFWLGTVALALRLRVKQRMQDALLLSLQMGFLVFYLLSAGYDRFGFLLLFIPAIYLAEFLPYLWKEAQRKPQGRLLRSLALVALLLLLFSQQTYLRFGQRILHPSSINPNETAAAAMLSAFPSASILTAEQQMTQFIDPNQHPIRLVAIVPSHGRQCAAPHPQFQLGVNELLLAGPYAFTEYAGCIDWSALVPLDSLGPASIEPWVLYGRK